MMIPLSSKMHELESLGTRRIVIQPWPHSLYQVMSLSALLMNNGWHAPKQVVTFDKDHHYVTLGFDRVNKQTNDDEKSIKKALSVINEEIAFSSLPFLRWNSYTNEFQRKEMQTWLNYLRRQQVTLKKHAERTNANLLEPHWIELSNAVSIEVARLSLYLEEDS